jgi:3'-phosphoadenosine 5'-phosphosulfate (PAPS) 3'-phosphatase
MAARITELVNATLRGEAGPEAQLTEAQVRDLRSAAPCLAVPLCRFTLKTQAVSQASARHTEPTEECALMCDDVMQVLDLIDQGGSEGGAKGRHWVLDPIDGTRGFVGLRQYAICLGMLQDGQVSAFKCQ